MIVYEPRCVMREVVEVANWRRANIRVLVRCLGGAAAVAERLGVTKAAVYQWVRANSLPLGRAVELAQELGVSRDMLHDPWHGMRPASEVMSEAETEALLAETEALLSETEALIKG